MTVRRAALVRWAVVLVVLAVLAALPSAISAWPARAASLDPATLKDRIAASGDRAYEGYAISVGALGLPAFPQLGRVASLLSDTTRTRTWYAAPDRWRIDEVTATGEERGVYRVGANEYLWDFSASRLIEIAGQAPARLPRAADLVPPELGRRLLATASGDRVEALPGRRVAGVDAAGLRITPVDPATTIGSVDIWADPATGLPVHVEVYARGYARPLLTARFLDLAQSVPAADVLTPPEVRAGIGFTVTRAPDIVGTIGRNTGAPLPATLAGQPRRDPDIGVPGIGIYGTGLAQFVVLPLPRRFGNNAYRTAVAYGTPLTFDKGDGALVATSLVSLLVVNTGNTTYILAGLIDPNVLRQAAVGLP